MSEMDSSPFEPSPSQRPYEPTRPTSPFAQCGPPRLGILHLLVLTACVATYLGCGRAFRQAFAAVAESGTAQTVTFSPRPLEVAQGTLLGIGYGAALAGVLLWIARRWQGRPFPLHPGEFLLVMSGVAVAAQIAMWPVQWMIVAFQPPARYGLLTALSLMSLAIQASVWIWALVCLKTRRWRVFLLLIPASYLLLIVVAIMISMLGANVAAGNWSPLGVVIARLLVMGVLAIVLLKDHFAGARYPWTHWYGIATRMWIDGASAVAMLLWVLLPSSADL
ncbi:MAG: hypothetical protein JXB62_12990 [Pirellulales bacterium]|nr:hypothetical protein [Pirellulales bacterium]